MMPVAPALPDFAGWPMVAAALDWLAGRSLLTNRQEAELLAEAQARGEADAAAFVARLRAAVSAAAETSLVGGEDSWAWRARLGRLVQVSHHAAESMGRTALHRAYQQGLAASLDTPGVGEEYPCWLYEATADTRTRASHRAMDGAVARRGTPAAARMEELVAEYGCRCVLTPLRADDPRCDNAVTSVTGPVTTPPVEAARAAPLAAR